jgi:hypothetical protein
MDDVRTYESPPRRPEPWLPRRPGDLKTGQPRGVHFGNPGPDQGYALLLARRLQHRIFVQPGESLDDTIQGCLPIALKRASLMGRAPVIHDLVVAFTVWGFLDETPTDDLVAKRKSLFAGVAHASHHLERDHLVAMVPISTLRMTPEEIRMPYVIDWPSLLDLKEPLRVEHRPSDD